MVFALIGGALSPSTLSMTPKSVINNRNDWVKKQLGYLAGLIQQIRAAALPPLPVTGTIFELLMTKGAQIIGFLVEHSITFVSVVGSVIAKAVVDYINSQRRLVKWSDGSQVRTRGQRLVKEPKNS